MFIGHLPAGYISSKLFFRKEQKTSRFYLAGLIGAVAPDFDMFYFYLFDNRHHHHHTYWPHFPIVWILLILITGIWYSSVREKKWSVPALLFSLNGFVHILLDTIVGDIWWFAPFSNISFAFFTVPALYKPWWLNFFLHWSFGLELTVVVGAILLLFRPKFIESKS